MGRTLCRSKVVRVRVWQLRRKDISRKVAKVSQGWQGKNGRMEG
jgi:hypothetical protein